MCAHVRFMFEGFVDRFKEITDVDDVNQVCVDYLRDAIYHYEQDIQYSTFDVVVKFWEEFEAFKNEYGDPHLSEGTFGFCRRTSERTAQIHIWIPHNPSARSLKDLYHEIEHIAQYMVDFQTLNDLPYSLRPHEILARYHSTARWSAEQGDAMELLMYKSVAKKEIQNGWKRVQELRAQARHTNNHQKIMRLGTKIDLITQTSIQFLQKFIDDYTGLIDQLR